MTAFKKKVLAFALAGTFALSQSAFVSAAVDTTETTNINKYDTVRKEMNLIQGDGQQVDLHKPLERYRAFVLYARMLGQADELQAYIDAYTTGDNFGDAAGQSPYVQGAMAFFKEKGMSDGDNHGNFRPHDSIIGQDFYKMMLQALGYVVDEDFTFAETADKALELGLIADKEIAGTNALEEVQIGAALYDTLNTAVKPAADAAADAPVVILAKKLALEFESAIPYLQAFDKTAPTLTVTEPHAYSRNAAGSNAVVVDGNSVTGDVVASASVNMPAGMPLDGTLSEAGTVHYNFNGVEGTIAVGEDGIFDTTKMEVFPEGSVDGKFPLIQNNKVVMWAEDLAGNKTKEVTFDKMTRTQKFYFGGTYTASGSSIGVVSGNAVDFYVGVDLESIPTAKVGTTEVKFTEIKASEIPDTLKTKLTVSVYEDTKYYKATIALPTPTTEVVYNATSSEKFGSVKKLKDGKFTFVSESMTALAPTFDNGTLGGVNVTFNTTIDPTTVAKANFKVDGDDVDSVVIAKDNKSLYIVKEMKQNTEHTITMKGVRTADGQFTMADATQKMTVTDVTAPAIVDYLILAPNRVRLYLSEAVHGDAVKDVNKYKLNSTDKVSAVESNKLYIDITGYKAFANGANKVVFDFRDGAGYAFSEYSFDYISNDTTPPTPEVFKATNNFIKLRFSELINKSTVSTSNVPGSIAAVVGEDSRGLPLVTYYFRGANNYLTQQTAGEITFNGVRDIKGNIAPVQKVTFTAYEDKDIATPSYKVDNRGDGTVATVGSANLYVTYDRPVLPAANSVNNFVLKKGDKIAPYYFSPVPSSAVKSTDGTVFGYTQYVATVLAGDVAGTYSLTITNMVDVPSGKGLPTATNDYIVSDNTIPKVVGPIVFDGTYLYITYNTPMDEASALNLNNYIVQSSVTSGYGAYLIKRDDYNHSLSADKKTAILAVTNVTAGGSTITVRGVYGTNKNPIEPSATDNSFIAVVNNAIQPTLANATATITGLNTLKIVLDGDNRLADSIALTDISINTTGSSLTSVNLLAADMYATFTTEDGGKVIKYTFSKNMFTPAGRVRIDNADYGRMLTIKANGTQDNIFAVNQYGKKLLANSSSEVTAIDGIAASVTKQPFVMVTESTTSYSSIYIGYNEELLITDPIGAAYSFAVTKVDGTQINPAHVSVSLVNDSTAYTAAYANASYAPYSDVYNYGKYNGVNSVLKVSIDYYAAGLSSNTWLKFTPAAKLIGIYDANGTTLATSPTEFTGYFVK